MTKSIEYINTPQEDESAETPKRSRNDKDHKKIGELRKRRAKRIDQGDIEDISLQVEPSDIKFTRENNEVAVTNFRDLTEKEHVELRVKKQVAVSDRVQTPDIDPILSEKEEEKREEEINTPHNRGRSIHSEIQTQKHVHKLIKNLENAYPGFSSENTQNNNDENATDVIGGYEDPIIIGDNKWADQEINKPVKNSVDRKISNKETNKDDIEPFDMPTIMTEKNRRPGRIVDANNIYTGEGFETKHDKLNIQDNKIEIKGNVFDTNKKPEETVVGFNHNANKDASISSEHENNNETLKKIENIHKELAKIDSAVNKLSRPKEEVDRVKKQPEEMNKDEINERRNEILKEIKDINDKRSAFFKSGDYASYEAEQSKKDILYQELGEISEQFKTKHLKEIEVKASWNKSKEHVKNIDDINREKIHTIETEVIAEEKLESSTDTQETQSNVNKNFFGKIKSTIKDVVRVGLKPIKWSYSKISTMVKEERKKVTGDAKDRDHKSERNILARNIVSNWKTKETSPEIYNNITSASALQPIIKTPEVKNFSEIKDGVAGRLKEVYSSELKKIGFEINDDKIKSFKEAVETIATSNPEKIENLAKALEAYETTEKKVKRHEEWIKIEKEKKADINKPNYESLLARDKKKMEYLKTVEWVTNFFGPGIVFATLFSKKYREASRELKKEGIYNTWDRALLYAVIPGAVRPKGFDKALKETDMKIAEFQEKIISAKYMPELDTIERELKHEKSVIDVMRMIFLDKHFTPYQSVISGAKEEVMKEFLTKHLKVNNSLADIESAQTKLDTFIKKTEENPHGIAHMEDIDIEALQKIIQSSIERVIRADIVKIFEQKLHGDDPEQLILSSLKPLITREGIGKKDKIETKKFLLSTFVELVKKYADDTEKIMLLVGIIEKIKNQ